MTPELWTKIEAEGPKPGQLWYFKGAGVFEVTHRDPTWPNHVGGKLIAAKDSFWYTEVNSLDLYPECNISLFDPGAVTEIKTDHIMAEPTLEGLTKPSIVNPIHYNDVPETEEELTRAMEITRLLCQ